LLRLSLSPRYPPSFPTRRSSDLFIVVIPAVASLLPGFDLTPKLALIPILSTSLVCKEIVAGTFHWNYILLILLSSSVYAAAALFLAVKMFQRESVLFRSSSRQATAGGAFAP